MLAHGVAGRLLRPDDETPTHCDDTNDDADDSCDCWMAPRSTCDHRSAPRLPMIVGPPCCGVCDTAYRQPCDASVLGSSIHAVSGPTRFTGSSNAAGSRRSARSYVRPANNSRTHGQATCHAPTAVARRKLLRGNGIRQDTGPAVAASGRDSRTHAAALSQACHSEPDGTPSLTRRGDRGARSSSARSRLQ